MEYGFSLRATELAGAMAIQDGRAPSATSLHAGDGSYMMMNSEAWRRPLMMGIKITVVITGTTAASAASTGCRWPPAGRSFNNLPGPTRVHAAPSQIDFAAHAASMGAEAVKPPPSRSWSRRLAQAEATGEGSLCRRDRHGHPIPHPPWRALVGGRRSPRSGPRAEVNEARGFMRATASVR